MTKKRNTKRALLMSLLSLVLCMSMFIGSTFAWFTDSVTSAGNKIQSGTLVLDLELLTEKEDGTTEWVSIKKDKTALFDYDKWEPGYTEYKVLKVENEGSLALKWYAKFVSEEEMSILADAIDVYVCPSATELKYPADRDLEGYTKVGTVAEFVNTIETTTKGELNAKESAYLGIALKMQEEAGNEYQDKTIGAFDIQILATQKTYESDSFGDQYDANATYPVVSMSVPVPEQATEPITLDTGDIAVELPAALVNALPDDVEELSVKHSGPRNDLNNNAIVFDEVDVVDQHGNVVDLEALNTDEKFTVTLPVKDKFTTGQVVKIYHDDVQIAEGTVDAEGNVTYEAAHFCKVTVAEKVFITVTFTDGFKKNFTSLKSAMRFGYSNGAQEAIIVYEDITEEMDYLEGNIVCGKEGGVTIKNTIYDEWIYCNDTNFTIGEGVTYDATGYNSGLFVYGDDCVINGTVVTDCYYQRYGGTKLTINAPGSMTVNTETFILRLTDGDPNAGIYINGDNNDETVEFKLAVAYFYQGMISAKDATLKVGTYWQTNGTDGEGSANLVLDNSKLTVTVNEHNFKATGNSTVTLKNGSVLDVAGGIETTNEIVADATSVVKKVR